MEKVVLCFLWLGLVAGQFFLPLSIQGQTLNIGDPAPPLQVEGWLRNEPAVPLEKGRVHVVEFWATWCQPCLAGIPHLNKIAERYADRGLQLYGINIMERGGVSLDSLKRFMETPIGKSMDYIAAADGASRFMQANWFTAMGERGIPFAVVVDQSGRIAWKGHPNGLDRVLPDILDGKWDLTAQVQALEENVRLSELDAGELVYLLNPYMGKDYAGALRVLDSILVEKPELLYYPRFGHFRAYSLIGTRSPEAVSFIRKWWEANDVPSWKSISDAVGGFSVRRPELLTPELYLLGAEALQAQLDNYPWSMNFARTYEEMARHYEKAGKPDLAAEMRKKAESIPAEQ